MKATLNLHTNTQIAQAVRVWKRPSVYEVEEIREARNTLLSWVEANSKSLLAQDRGRMVRDLTQALEVAGG